MPCLKKEKTVLTDIPSPTMAQALTKTFWERESDKPEIAKMKYLKHFKFRR